MRSFFLLAMDDKVNPNYVTTFKSYSLECEWKISNVKSRLSNPQSLVYPGEIKSPPNKSPASTWSLYALQPTEESYTVKLYLISDYSVWARAKIGVKVKSPRRVDLQVVDKLSQYYDSRCVTTTSELCYVTNYLSIEPYCCEPNTIQMYRNSYSSTSSPREFTAVIPKSGFDKYLDGDDLVIHCCIFVNELDKPVHTENIPVIEDKAPHFDLSKVMEDARHKDRYTDVTIVSADKEFKAHKVVLASQSAFFETGLEERWKKDGAHRVEMLDVPADTMDTILTYMYTGKVENINRSALDLFPKAEEYQLEGLKFMCEEALSKTLTAETVIDVLVMADTHNAQNLKQSCLMFITKNITDVKKSSAWTEEKLKSAANKDLKMEVMEHVIKSL